MITPGAVLSTANVVLGPPAGAALPALSAAVPGLMLKPSVPSPLTPVKVIVRTRGPNPAIFTVPVAEPVLLTTTSDALSVTADAPV